LSDTDTDAESNTDAELLFLSGKSLSVSDQQRMSGGAR
jgi:hypothetical protein